MPVEQMLADLREIAAEMGAELTILGDGYPARVNDERYHLTLTLNGRVALDGWWGIEATARKKYKETVGDYGRDGARIVLVDTETGEELASWP